MLFISALEDVKRMTGNIDCRNGTFFISTINMRKLPYLVKQCSNLESILITPFLINQEKNIYELHYYEFEIEVSSSQKSNYVEYEQGNILPDEIIENIKPKAIIRTNDKPFFILAIDKYLLKMDQMKFLEDKKRNPSLENASLYYQIY